MTGCSDLGDDVRKELLGRLALMPSPEADAAVEVMLEVQQLTTQLDVEALGGASRTSPEERLTIHYAHAATP